MSQYFLPEAVDLEGDSVIVKMGSSSPATTFTSMKEMKLLVFFPQLSHVGIYSLDLILQDTNMYPMQTKYKLKITVYNPVVEVEKSETINVTENLLLSEFAKYKNLSGSLKAKIVSITNYGLVTIFFSKKMYIPTNFTSVLNNSLSISVFKEYTQTYEWFNYTIRNYTVQTLTLLLSIPEPKYISTTLVSQYSIYKYLALGFTYCAVQSK